MSKRAPQFERREKDFYPTPFSAVQPLLRELPTSRRYIEPCAGDGALIRHLECDHDCIGASDIAPRDQSFMTLDATNEQFDDFSFDCFITNPPWDRKILQPIIANLSAQAPTWLLFDADWMHTRQAAPYLPWCRKIIAVGRVKWIPDSPHTSKDNCAWYLFDQAKDGPTVFVGRQ